MAESFLETLKAIDIGILTHVVRQDQNDPSLEISHWDVKRLSDKGIDNPNGLWLFSGQSMGGGKTSTWFVVLKILTRQQEELPADSVWHWKREFLFAQSDLPKLLPSPVRAPRIYRSEETPDGAWIWMEYLIGNQPGLWTLDDYAFAAHQLGLWNGRYLVEVPLPSEGWLTRQHYRSWLGAIAGEHALKFPLNQKYISSKTLDRYNRLWSEREIFFKVLENLPQVFSHFDSQRRNLFIRQNAAGQRELVLLDWQQCGVNAIGAELNWLIGLSAALFEWPPAELIQLEEITFPSYIRGLYESGWSGNLDIVRLGFASMLAVYLGCAFPGLAAWWCEPAHGPFALQQFRLVEEELYLAWLPLFDYSLERADEARLLMKKTNFE